MGRDRASARCATTVRLNQPGSWISHAQACRSHCSAHDPRQSDQQVFGVPSRAPLAPNPFGANLAGWVQHDIGHWMVCAGSPSSTWRMKGRHVRNHLPRATNCSLAPKPPRTRSAFCSWTNSDRQGATRTSRGHLAQSLRRSAFLDGVPTAQGEPIPMRTAGPARCVGEAMILVLQDTALGGCRSLHPRPRCGEKNSPPPPPPPPPLDSPPAVAGLGAGSGGRRPSLTWREDHRCQSK